MTALSAPDSTGKTSPSYSPGDSSRNQEVLRVRNSDSHPRRLDAPGTAVCQLISRTCKEAPE